MKIYTTDEYGKEVMIPPYLQSMSLENIWVKGGAKRLFDQSDAKSQMELGAELQEMMRYKNLVFIRYSDLYSVQLHEAYTSRKELSLLVKFLAYGKGGGMFGALVSTLDEPPDLQSASMLTADAVITDFQTFSKDSGSPREKVTLKLKKPELTFQ
jgi:hypothetical protein